MKVFFIFIISLLLSSCNTAFFVSKDRVIFENTGYLFFDPYYRYVKFIPSKIDTCLTLSMNFEKYKLGKAFYMHGIPSKELSYLGIYGDTLQSGWVGWVIVPIEIKYRRLRNLNRQLKEQATMYNEDFIVIDNKIYYFKINQLITRYYSAFPLLSEERKRQKLLNYVE